MAVGCGGVEVLRGLLAGVVLTHLARSPGLVLVGQLGVVVRAAL